MGTGGDDFIKNSALSRLCVGRVGVRGGDDGEGRFSRDLGISSSLGLLYLSSQLLPSLSTPARNGIDFSCAGRTTGLSHETPVSLSYWTMIVETFQPNFSKLKHCISKMKRRRVQEGLE